MDDEIQAIQAIFCGPGEFTQVQCNEFCIQVRVEGQPTIEALFALPNTYPTTPAAVTLTCHQPLYCVIELQSKVNEYARTLAGEAMLLSIILWLQDQLQGCQVDTVASSSHKQNRISESGRLNDAITEGKKLQSSEVEKSNAPTVDRSEPEHKTSCRPSNVQNSCLHLATTVLHVDHMRARAKYVRNIQRWIKELSLVGRLLFYGEKRPLILILLQGTVDNLKKYMHLHRSVCVDVDSAGRSCKERKLGVLCQLPCASLSFTDFRVISVTDAPALQRELASSGHAQIYKEHVLPVLLEKH